MAEFIPVNVPLLDGAESKYLSECIETGWISSEGPFVEKSESEFARRVGRGHGIAVTSGTAALDVAVAALKIGPGDEVILPTFTIISCVAAIVRAGATPVVVDSDPGTWNMDPAAVERHVTPRTKAIMAVHIYGLPVDMAPILALAERHGLYVIEDAAEAIGQTCGTRPCGSFGDISIFSFYPNKHVTTGEGGMVVTDDAALMERARSLRNLCFQPERRFVHEELGWNYRMTNLQAALGMAQLENLDRHLSRKREIGRLYDSLLSGCGHIQRPLQRTGDAENLYWVYGVVLNDGVEFDAVVAMRELAKSGIGTRPFFWPMHEQPVFRKMNLFEDVRCPVAERLGRRGFYLPSGLGLSDAQVERSAAALKSLFS